MRVVGQRTAKDTAALIEEVARGERLLEEIKDPELRETVRLALRLHKDPYSGPDAKTRSRIRSRVFRTLRPGPASLADRIAITFEILAKPTPYAMRAFAIALVVGCVGASTALVSAGTVADDPLYSVKIASEQVRLALAATPEDRAIVELSIAEHRLAEAATLANAGYDDDVIVATSEYGEHLANAAAELAQVESVTPETATLVTQLKHKMDEHRATAAAVVARLADDPSTAPAAAALSVLATTNVPSQDLSPAPALAPRSIPGDVSSARRADAAFLIAILAGVLFIALLGPLGRRLEMVHQNDFSGFWSGPRTVLAGGDPWDPTSYVDTAVELGTKKPDANVYDYMPWVLFALLPLAALPLEVAGWIWMILSMTIAVIALRALLRAFVPGRPLIHGALGLALFVGQPGFHAVVLGQWALLLMSATAAVVLAVRAGHARRAAFAALAFLAKPQIFVWTALGLAIAAAFDQRYRRFVRYAVVLGGAVVICTWLAFPDWFPAWLADIPPRRTGRSAVLLSAFGQVFGTPGRVLAVGVIIGGVALASAFVPGSDAWLPGRVRFSAMASSTARGRSSGNYTCRRQT